MLWNWYNWLSLWKNRYWSNCGIFCPKFTKIKKWRNFAFSGNRQYEVFQSYNTIHKLYTTKLPQFLWLDTAITVFVFFFMVKMLDFSWFLIFFILVVYIQEMFMIQNDYLVNFLTFWSLINWYIVLLLVNKSNGKKCKIDLCHDFEKVLIVEITTKLSSKVV